MSSVVTRRPFSQILLGRPLETSAAPHQSIGLAFRHVEGVAITNIAFQLHHQHGHLAEVGHNGQP